MKIITKEEVEAQYHATALGGLKGLLFGSAVALPSSWYFNMRSPYYRQLPPSLKALGAIMIRYSQ